MAIAPIIDLVDHDGTPVHIPDPELRRAWMLYFMRTSSCPPCLSHVKRIDAAADEFRALGVVPLVVVPDGDEAARALHRRFRLRVTVASSPGDDVHAMFGLQKRLFGIAQQSGTVLVGSDGQIHHQRVAMR